MFDVKYFSIPLYSYRHYSCILFAFVLLWPRETRFKDLTNTEQVNLMPRRHRADADKPKQPTDDTHVCIGAEGAII